MSAGSYRYSSDPQLAQLVTTRPDSSELRIGLPAPPTALFVHDSQLYVGFASGQLQIYAVGGAEAASPRLTLVHNYPHAIAGFALTEGQVVALPAATSPRSYEPEPPSSRDDDMAQAKAAREPRSGLGQLILGVVVAGGIGVPAMTVGLDRRLDREGDGVGWITVGGVGLGVGIILLSVGGKQALRHKRWADKYQARLTPFVATRRAGSAGRGWTAGATLRF